VSRDPSAIVSKSVDPVGVGGYPAVAPGDEVGAARRRSSRTDVGRRSDDVKRSWWKSR
jgi:hypothetical protein